MDGLAQIRGTALMSYRAYLDKTYGPSGVARVLEALSPEDRAMFEHIVLATEWYPVESFVRAIDAATERLGGDFPDKYGAFGAEYEIGSFFRFVLRFSNPGWLVDRGTKVWRGSHTTGTWETERRERFIRGTLTGFAVVSSRYCRVLCAWFKRASQMTGADTVRVEHPRCRVAGAPACVYELTW